MYQSTLYGFTLRAQIMIADIAATTATCRGIAVGALVVVINIAAGTTARLCVAPRTQIMITDVPATAATFLGIAVGALVAVINVAAGTTARLGVAPRTQIVIIDVPATAAALPGIAIGALVMIINIAATGKRVASEHQHHPKNQFHFTLP